MYRTLLMLLLVVCACNSSQQPLQVTDAVADSIFDKTGIHLNELILTRNKDSVYRYLDSIRPQMEGYNHNGLASTWYRLKGIAAITFGDYAEAKNHLDISLALAREKDTINKYYGSAITRYGMLKGSTGNMDSALLLGRKGYSIAKAHNDEDGLVTACVVLAGAHQQLGDGDNTLKYLKEGLRLAKRSAAIEYFINNLSAYYWDKGNMDSSLFYMKMLVNSPTTHDVNRVMQLQNLGITMVKLGRFDEAKTYMDQALALSKSRQQEQDWAYYNMAGIYKEMKDISKAILYHDSAIALARNAGNEELLVEAYKERAEILKEQGDFRGALKFADSLNASQTRYFAGSRAAEAKEVEARFTNLEKDAAITNLKIDKAEAAQANSRQLLIIMAILFVAVLGASYLFYRLRKRKQVEHGLQQQLLRSQLEPHFIFNSLGTLQSYIDDGFKEKATAYLSKFSRLAKISLVNARQSWVPLADEIEALEAYLALQASNYQNFTYEVNIYPDYEQDELLIPTMLLQPFVENAVIHGVSPLPSEGHIQVTVVRQEKYLQCLIEDNGVGIRHRADTPGKPSLSTQITEERLVMLGREAGMAPLLKIKDKKQAKGRGVIVELDLPYREDL